MEQPKLDFATRQSTTVIIAAKLAYRRNERAAKSHSRKLRGPGFVSDQIDGLLGAKHGQPRVLPTAVTKVGGDLKRLTTQQGSA